MERSGERNVRLPFRRESSLSGLMKACSAYNAKRASFASQPKSNIKRGVWHGRKEAQEMLRVTEDLIRALLSDSNLCPVKTKETDLGLAPTSAVVTAMWGEAYVCFVFFGGKLTADNIGW